MENYKLAQFILLFNIILKFNIRSQRQFNKTDFAQNDQRQYQIEFKMSEIAEGTNLIVEKRDEKGEYEMVQAHVRKLNNRILVVWDHPFNDRIIFDE